MRAACALYRLILRLAPRAFRSRYADEADAAFARLLSERRRRAGLAAAAHIALLAIADAARTVAREWRRVPAGWQPGVTPDLRHAARVALARPGYSLAVVLTLGVTAGTLTAALAFVDPLILRPLPFPDADRIVVAGTPDDSFTYDMVRASEYARVRAATTTLENVSSHYGTASGDIAELPGWSLQTATPEFLPLVGAEPVLGRGFAADEFRQDPPHVALITNAFWQSRYAGYPGVLGGFLDVRSYSGRDRYRIIGVLPPSFTFPAAWSREHVAAIIPGDAEGIGPRPTSRMPMVARLKPGVSLKQAQAELSAIVMAADADPVDPVDMPTLIPLRESLYGEVAPVLRLILLGAAGVLLVGCANLAQLVMARLRDRRRELTVRRALGASRVRLARMLAAEAALLTLAGLGVAAVVALAALGALARAVPYYEHAYRQLTFALDGRAWIFLAASTVMASLLAQVVPMLAAVRARGGSAVTRENARAGRRTRGDALFVGVQAAVAMALVVCSLQVFTGFMTLRRQTGGFDPAGLRFVSVLHTAGAPRRFSPAMHDLMRRSFEAVAARAGASVAAFGGFPGGVSGGDAARAADPPPDETGVRIMPMSASGFSLLGLHLRRGRFYDEGEAWTEAPVAVIDRRGAELLWPGRDPIGREVIGVGGAVLRVVGMVETLGLVRERGELRTGALFTPFSRGEQGSFNLMYRPGPGLRGSEDARAILVAVHPSTLTSEHPYLPFERAMGPPRFAASVLATLSALALLLAAIGLFGMVAHAVLSRTREIAVRMALGARPRDVQSSVTGAYVVAGGVGLVAGVAIALRATPVLQQVSADVRPDDPWLFAQAAALLAIVLAVASAGPVRRASRIDPALTLKAE